MKRLIDRSVGAYFFGPPCICVVNVIHDSQTCWPLQSVSHHSSCGLLPSVSTPSTWYRACDSSRQCPAAASSDATQSDSRTVPAGRLASIPLDAEHQNLIHRPIYRQNTRSPATTETVRVSSLDHAPFRDGLSPTGWDMLTDQTWSA